MLISPFKAPPAHPILSRKYVKKAEVDPENKGVMKFDRENKGVTALILKIKGLVPIWAIDGFAQGRGGRENQNRAVFFFKKPSVILKTKDL